MNLEEFCERVVEGDINPIDIPVLAAIILAIVVVVVGEIGCVIWFFGILISTLLGGGAAKLLMLIPCAVIFSILTAIILTSDEIFRGATTGCGAKYYLYKCLQSLPSWV